MNNVLFHTHEAGPSDAAIHIKGCTVSDLEPTDHCVGLGVILVRSGDFYHMVLSQSICLKSGRVAC